MLFCQENYRYFTSIIDWRIDDMIFQNFSVSNAIDSRSKDYRFCSLLCGRNDGAASLHLVML